MANNNQTAAQCLMRILSGYPGMAAKDLEAFSALAVTALAVYPDPVLVALANPRTGILHTSKFLPTVAEMAEWCERERMRLYKLASEQDRQERIAAHRALPPPDPSEVERRARVDAIVRAGMERLHNELAGNAGIRISKALTADDRLAACAWLDEQSRQPPPRLRLSDAALDKIGA